MTVGSSSYNGLAPSLLGENEFVGQVAATDIMTITGASSQSGDYLVIRESDGTELLWMKADGQIWHRPSTTVNSVGFWIQHTGDFEGTGGSVALQSVLQLAAGTGANTQNYAAWFWLNSSSYNVGGGREAVLHLYYQAGNTSAHAGTGFMFFDDGGTNAQIAFNFSSNLITNGCIITGAGDATATAGIRCMFGTTVYYILCATCLG